MQATRRDFLAALAAAGAVRAQAAEVDRGAVGWHFGRVGMSVAEASR